MNPVKQYGRRVLTSVLSLALLVGLVPALAAEDPGFAFGSQQTQLTPGVYDLPVKLNKAADHSAPSMAGSCVTGGTLTVAETGEAAVTLSLGPVQVSSIVGWGQDWQYYTRHWDTSAEADYLDPQYLSPCTFTTAPQEGADRVNSITFPVPVPEADGVYLHMYIDVMQSAQDAFLSLDYAHAIRQTETFPFGPQGIRLAPGEYTVPVSLRKADKHDDPSAAASAFPAQATLTVRPDGSARLVTDIQPVVVGPVSDMAYEIGLYSGDSPSGEPTPVDILATTPKPNPMPSAGRIVPTKIAFELPDAALGGVYLRFMVDAMGYAPDAWLRIDYPQAVDPGQTQRYEGSIRLFQFGKYNINVVVSVDNGLISNVDISADDYAGHFEEVNSQKMASVIPVLSTAWNGLAPTQDNAEAIYNAIETPEVLDAVSGATYSAKGVRDAVMDAFDLAYKAPITVPESVDPGIYQVEVGYYAEVGNHSLVENDTTTATLVVRPDGSMQMDLDPVSGSAKEPMYIMALNGVYPDNDRSNPLTMANCSQVKEDTDFTDQFFPQDWQVATHISFPLLGGLQRVYYTNMYLYVPAMNKLNGEIYGVDFDNGRFNTDIITEVYWDGMERIGDVDSPVQARSAALRSGCQLTEEGIAPFTLSLTDPSRISALELRYETDGRSIQLRGLNGFAKLGNDQPTYTADGRLVGTATFIYLGESQLTAQGPVDVVALDVLDVAGGKPTVTITGLKLAGRDKEEQPVYGPILSGLDPAQATFPGLSPYDLNRDGLVDLLDLTTAQAHYQARSGDADWADASVCDFNGDLTVDVADFVELYLNYTI